MVWARGSVRAGTSAGRRFDELARAWRRRVLRPVFLGCFVLAIAFTVAGIVTSGSWKFWFGMLAGATLALYVALWDSPPSYIEHWRAGQEGERRTAKALRPLTHQGWRVRHDIVGGSGSNLDHVVIGDPGVFLLDSKRYAGEAIIEDGELRMRWPEDPDHGWTCHGIDSRMRGASAELKERIEAATGVRAWVHPVVVLWSTFPQRVAEVDGVIFVHGEALAGWLRDRPPRPRPIDKETLARFLEALPSATSER